MDARSHGHRYHMDCGEAKPDSDIEYGGLSAFDSYRDIQKDWLEEIVQSDAFKGASVKVVVIHMPPFGGWHGEEDIASKFVSVLEDAGVDIMFCGHLHRHIKKEAGDVAKFPVIANSNTHAIKASVKGNKMDVTIISDTGEVVDSFSITGK